MKEYKAIYNETLDTVTFYDENGESHLLYVHTKEDHEYLCDKWLNTAYVRILNFIIVLCFLFSSYHLLAILTRYSV